MIWVYVIGSKVRSYRYVGMTNDVDRRVEEHNKGYNKTTRSYAPFRLLYKEEFPNRKEARKREKYLKTAAGRRFIKNLKDQ